MLLYIILFIASSNILHCDNDIPMSVDVVYLSACLPSASREWRKGLTYNNCPAVASCVYAHYC